MAHPLEAAFGRLLFGALPLHNVPMADYLAEQLGKMLDQYDEQRRAVLAREPQVKDDDDRFLQGFAALRRDVVRPVFEAAGKILAERGHKVSITEQEFTVGADSKVAEAEISIRINERSFSISTRHYNKMVWFNAGKPLEAGGAKSTYPLERIDRQLVEEELVKFVAAIVAG
jgi:hypothetical protein